MVDIPVPATNEQPPASAVFAIYVPGEQPDNPGRIISMDLATYSALVSAGTPLWVSGIAYDEDTGIMTVTTSESGTPVDQEITLRLGAGVTQPVIGSVRLCFFDDQDAQLLIQTNGPYDIELLELPGQAIAAGDRILVQCGSLEGGSQVVLRHGLNQSDAATAPVDIVDEFVVLEATQAATGFSIWLQGNHVGSLRFTRRAVYCCRGTNDQAIGAIKAALVSAVDPENFPLAYNSQRVYVPGERFHYQNAVYETLQHTIGQSPPNETYYRKILDGASVSNSDIDARIADWAEEGNSSAIPANKLRNAPQRSNADIDARIADWAEAGNSDQIPMAKLPDVGTDGIAANLVEDFAKTNFPDSRVPFGRLPGLSTAQSPDGITLKYSDDIYNSNRNLRLADDTNAGLLSPAEHLVINDLHSWAHNDERLPKSALPADVRYGLLHDRAEWRADISFSTGDICRATETGGNRRFFIAARANTNVNPLQTNTSWLELAQTISVPDIRGRGVWNAGTSYYPGNFVTTVECLYVCTAPVSGGTNPKNDAAHWDLLFYLNVDASDDGEVHISLDEDQADGIAINPGWLYPRGDWSVGTFYVENNLVKRSGTRYLCIAQHTAANNNAPGTGVNRDTYWEVW